MFCKKNKHLVFIVTFFVFAIYTVSFANNGYYLDDLIVTYKEQGKRFKTTEKYIYEWDIIKTVVVKNSDWSRCPLSDKFLNKYNNKDSILPNYDVKELVFSKKYKIIIDGQKKDMVSIVLTNGIELPVLTKVKWNENKEVDDILIYIIPEDKMDMPYEELYKMVFDE